MTRKIFNLKNTFLTIIVILAATAGANALTINLANGQNYSATPSIGNDTELVFNVASGTAYISSNIVCMNMSNVPVPFIKTGAGKLVILGTITAQNSSLGLAVQVQSGTLQIGNGTTSGTMSVTQIDISSGAILRYEQADFHTVSYLISGAGGVEINNIVYFTANNTYTGRTNINSGTIVLSGSGTIASSSEVYLGSNTAKFEITGNKTIKALNASASYTSAEVILGSNILTIGTDATATDGTGTFYGFFSGTGGSVTKTGSGAFTMRGSNTATGTFTHNAGTVVFHEQWRGSYTLNGGIWDIKGSVNIGSAGVGVLSTNGGTISMNLLQTASPAKSRINVAGNVSSTGVTLSISLSAGAGTQTLITAAGGITSTTNYTLNIPGLTATLSANTTSLSISNATVTDITPPVVGGSGVINATPGIEGTNLTWTAATDNQTTSANLRYYVYRSSSNNISTVANCESNGALLNPGGSLNITSYDATGLNPTTSYYFNVVVADLANNRSAYTARSVTTLKANLAGDATILGNAVFGETLSVNTTGITSNPVISDLGTLSYQWKRGTANINGAINPTYTIEQDDIDEIISVEITADNCQGSVSESTETVLKAEQTEPDAPTMLSKTNNSVTLNEITGCEYRVNGASWQTSAVFNGLLSNTTHSFEARKAETATHFASPPSSITEITTDVDQEALRVTVLPFAPDLKIYPNPFTVTVLVKTGEIGEIGKKGENMTLQIINAAGVVVHTLNITSPDEIIRLERLPPGVYFFMFEREGRTKTEKVVKD